MRTDLHNKSLYRRRARMSSGVVFTGRSFIDAVAGEQPAI
jgi:hypothetical protein